MSGPKIYVYPADTWGCGCYRLIWACQILRAQGHDVTVIPPNDRGRSFGGELDSTDDNRLTAVTQIPPDADVIVMQRVVLRQLAQAVPMLRAKGIAVVVDMDDDLTTIHPGNIAFTALHPVRGRNRYYSWTNAEQACRDATYVTVSTQPLLQVYAPHGRGQVLLNRIPAKYTDIVRHDSEVIGWGGSVHSHPDDLQTLGPAMARLLREGHRFRGIGAPDGIRQALGLEEEPDSFGAVDIREWPWALASLGVGIAPLADSQFNRAKCIDAETRIATGRGLIRIAEIEVGDTVWHDGRWRMVQGHHKEPASPGVRLTMKSGRELRLTREHRLWRVDGGWTQAKDLEVGHILAMTPDEFGTPAIQRAPWPSDGRVSRGAHDRQAFLSAEDVPTVAITERWARFLGLFAGDGCASGTHVTISCDGLDQDLIDLISEDAIAMGLWPSTEQGRTWGGELIRRRSVGVSSVHLIRFLRGLGAVEPTSVRRIVTVPEVIWRSPREIVAAFLRGLFEADGTISGSSVTLTTKYRSFAQQIQRLLTTFGIESTVAERWTAAKPGGPKYQNFVLAMRRAGTDVFAKEIGFLSARKIDRLDATVAKPHSNAYRPMSWKDEIVAVEECWLEPVDIQVEGSIFAAAGFVSHNSWLKPLEMSACGVPWVASPRPEYAALHQAGAGVMADRPRDWYRQLKALATSPERRAELSEAGRTVAAEHTIEGHAWRWLEAWSRALELQRRGARQPASVFAASR